MSYQVRKRDGKIADFDIAKIAHAIKLAFEAQNKQYHDGVIDFLALKVTADFEPGLSMLRIFRTPLNQFSFRQATRISPRRTFFTESSAKKCA